MQFLLTVGKSPPEQTVAPIFKQFEEEFTVSNDIYSDRAPAFSSILKDDRLLLADICGAVTSGLFKAGFMKTEHFVKSQLQCCRNTIANIGFSEIHRAKLDEIVHTAKHITVLVPGCQDDRMIERRVKALFEFVRQHKRSLKVVFSGKNPGTPNVTIMNEAQYMRARFEEFMHHHGGKFDVTVSEANCEENSKTTVQNIAELLRSKDFLNRGVKQTVVVISSSFHLIRIAEALLKHVKDDTHGLSKFIENFVLIGAENPESEELPSTYWEHPYVKLMMFDLFRLHLR